MSVDETHLRHCMIYELEMGLQTAETVRNICAMKIKSQVSGNASNALFGFSLGI